MRIKVAKKLPPEINMIPMIDVIMMLLIFFLVATRMKTEEDKIDLELPTSLEALIDAISKKEAAPIVVNIVPAKVPGSKPFYVGTVGMDRAGLASVLQEQAKKIYEMHGEKAAMVRMRCDKNAEFSQLQEALKACQTAQIATVYVAAEKPQ